MQEPRKIYLYDSYRARKVALEPVAGPEVSVYYCGPTVYNYVHVGNIRPVLTFDLLFRVLSECGYRVKMVSNYTDIDDKIIDRALKEGVSEKELTDKYIESYEETLAGLGVKPLFDRPRVSNYIPDIVGFIGKMLDSGHAYRAGGNVFFRVSAVDDYGALSKIKVDDLIAGARIETDGSKESPLDFALWKETDVGIKFPASFGAGRPGWHTECLVMIERVFGRPLIDIHGGGFDLKFPHHENEIAQSRALNKTALANIWMHVGFITFNDEKMSKSLGNVVLAKDALARYGADALRLFFLSAKYEQPLNFSDQALAQAEALASKYREVSDRLQALMFIRNIAPSSKPLSAEYEEFMAALADDLNVANALSALDRVCRLANGEARKSAPEAAFIASCFFTLNKMFDILGLQPPVRDFTAEDRRLYEEYEEARKARDFAASDRLRPKLKERHLL